MCGTEIETYEWTEELKNPQSYDKGWYNFSRWSKWQKKNDYGIQAMLDRWKHKNSSIFIFISDYFELPKRTIRANGIIFDIFQTKKFRDAQNL